MKIKNKVIGLSGVAGSGKDLFYELLSKNAPNIKRYALADKLKLDVEDFCLTEYGISSIRCNGDDKSMIRAFLVAHGNIKRNLSNGRYWIDGLTKFIKEDLTDGLLKESDIICITDIRYSEYKKDEVYWLKKELGGDLVHISKYTTRNRKRYYHAPANLAETENDPRVKKQADYFIKWPVAKGLLFNDKLEKYIDKFLIDFKFKHGEF